MVLAEKGKKTKPLAENCLNFGGDSLGTVGDGTEMAIQRR